jgi:hypothetical protein
VSAKQTGEGYFVMRFGEPLIRPPSKTEGTFSHKRRRLTLVSALVLSFALASPAFAEEIVDLELVLAIDASSSVDETEWALQRDGYEAAFRDPEIQAALASGPNKRIAVSVVVWADASVPRWESAWFVLSTGEDGEQMADFMANLPRIPMGGTGIGTGLASAIRKFDRNDLSAPRQVVDVSGDGRETPPRENVVLIPMAHALAVARGVTVNGLAIVNEDAGLATWYRDNVIAGKGSFVMDAADYADFAEAIRTKLLREIQHQERLSLAR